MTTPIHMTSEGKEALRKAVRGLRETLLDELKGEAERTYRLGVSLEKAKLPEARAKRRARLEAWADEQSRADWPKNKNGEAKKPPEKQLKALRERHLARAVKEAAHTLINRLVTLRILETAKLSQPAVVSGGRESAGYREFKDYAGALCSDAADDTKGYSALLKLVFDELAVDLPGVFGNVGLTSLFPIPASTLNAAVDALNDPALNSVWQDDTALGWVYQFWNDPERESLDDKINGGGKIEPHEIASKTQMFTERYMVEWLLQNSLGQVWLAMCKKHDWTPNFEQVRESLEARRAAWRGQRERGEVAPDELMPIHSELEQQWKYWVPQPMPEDAPAAAPERLLDLKILDPACGSGHFLVIAFDLLAALYREEARHRGEQVSDEQVAQNIIEHNLHGVDIDPRAIQIAAAALWVKGKQLAKDTAITRMNLVAPTFKLAALPADDPALTELKKRLKAEVGIPEELTAGLVDALSGVDHLGTLLRVDKSVRDSLATYEKANFGITAPKAQMTMFGEEPKQKIQLTLDEAEASVMKQLGKFLDSHEGESDLGLRLEGEQLAAGVRFLQIVREGTFDVVVGNPPYQGTSKMAEASWFKKHYPRSKADLYACFLERSLELAKPGGVSALLTMRGWMFLSSYQDLREGLLKENDLTLLGDIDRGGFEDIPDEVVAASMTLFEKRHSEQRVTVTIQPTSLDDKSRDNGRTTRKKAALMAQVGRYEFDVAKLSGIEGTPLVYWWDEQFLDEYVKAPKLGDVSPARATQGLYDNTRFTCWWHEVDLRRIGSTKDSPWVPFTNGANGATWFEPLRLVAFWKDCGMQPKLRMGRSTGSDAYAFANEQHFFREGGVAFSMIGSAFGARLSRFVGVFGDKGRSMFHSEPGALLTVLNAEYASSIMCSLNPSISFQAGDINRVPFEVLSEFKAVVNRIAEAFTQHESHRESSVEFKLPGPSPWRYAQAWAQVAVDRSKGAPLPRYEEELDGPEPTAFVSFAIGVALGRFGENGEGILDLSSDEANALRSGSEQTPTKAASNELDVRNLEPSPLPRGQEILPDGILFISAAPHIRDTSKHPAFARVVSAWDKHSTAIAENASLTDWLRKDFFGYHKGLYENRPIYFPLSSADKSFVAWVSIHRWEDNTLQTLLAHHLHPAREQLQGEINDLNTARVSSDKKAQAAAEKQYAKSQKLLEELQEFIADVTQIAEKGAPPTDTTCRAREVDAPFRMDLDDGVMINSAALWPLLLPQWKEPKKWWKELCTAKGRKDYDWAHLAARYFPDRVDRKCKDDPSLAVAHGCFWKYHPAKAYAWELRLQDEIAPDFTIDEANSDAYRAAFLMDHPDDAAEIRASEAQRRERNRKKAEKKDDANADGEEAQFELRAT